MEYLLRESLLPQIPAVRKGIQALRRSRMDKSLAVITFTPQKRYSSNARQRGFTLLEVMISLMIIAVVVVIFAGAVTVGQRAAGLNGEYAQALSLCQHKIDQLRTVGFYRLTYDELSDAAIIDPSKTTLPYRFTEVDEIAKYLPNATSTIDIKSTSDPEVVRVEVSVTWRNGSSTTKQSNMALNANIANTE